MWCYIGHQCHTRDFFVSYLHADALIASHKSLTDVSQWKKCLFFRFEPLGDGTCAKKISQQMYCATEIIAHCRAHLARYIKWCVAHAPGMPGTFSPPPQVSDPDMHHGTFVTHVPWDMPRSLTSVFNCCRWQWKRSRHSRSICNKEARWRHLCIHDINVNSFQESID